MTHRQPEVSQWLRRNGGDLAALEDAFSIVSACHEGLILLCYAPQSPHTSLVNDCRGLVLSASDYAPVGWPMDRFFDVVEKKPIVLEEPLRVEEKVDGSYIILFFDGRRWVACTRHTFCAIDPPYQDLILQASGCATLDVLAEQAGLDRAVTWCLELCSPQTRILQPVDAPTLYLLAAVGTTTRVPWTPAQLDAVAVRSGFFRRPLHHARCTTRAAAEALVARRAAEDLLFEGVVMVGASGNRLKLKSERYRLLGQLKYRGWRLATPKFMAPIVQADQTEMLLSVLSELRDDTAVLVALFEQFESVIATEVDAIRAVWQAQVGQARRSLAEQLRRDGLRTGRVLLSRWEAIGAQPPGPAAPARIRRWILDDQGILPKLFEGCWSGPSAVVRLMAGQPAPAPATQLVGTGTARRWPEETAAGWRVWCACGQEMRLERLKVARLRWRHDLSGRRMAILRYPAGSLLWVCDCGCDHEAHQRDRYWPAEDKHTRAGEPMGLPASQPCKMLRLIVHDLLLALRQARGWSRDGVYQWMAQVLALPRSEAHVARFDGARCLGLIQRLQKELGQDEINLS